MKSKCLKGHIKFIYPKIIEIFIVSYYCYGLSHLNPKKKKIKKKIEKKNESF